MCVCVCVCADLFLCVYPGLCLVPRLCSAPNPPHHVHANVQLVCLVKCSPKLASPHLRPHLLHFPFLLVGGKWASVVKAAALSRQCLQQLRLFLLFHHVPMHTNCPSSAGWANLYVAGHVHITPFTCLYSVCVCHRLYELTLV